MGINVLLLDDNKHDAEIFKSVAERSGHSVSHVDSLEALNGEARACDIVFCDLYLTGGPDATQVIGRVRDMVGAWKPVIAYSGSMDPKAIESAIHSGADAYQRKSDDVNVIDSALQVASAIISKRHGKKKLLQEEWVRCKSHSSQSSSTWWSRLLSRFGGLRHV